MVGRRRAMGDKFSRTAPVDTPAPASPPPPPPAAATDAASAAASSGEDQFSNHRDARPEERWHDSLDNLAREFRDVAATLSEQHDRAGYGARLKHLVFGLPGPVIGIAVSAVASLWTSEDAVFLIVPLSSLGAIFSAVHVFLNLAGRAQLHWTYSAMYGSVISRIDTTLARDIDFRIPPDAFFAEIRTEMNSLGGHAPQLPGKGCCGCSKYRAKPPLPAPTRSGDIYYDFRRRERPAARRLLLEV